MTTITEKLENPGGSALGTERIVVRIGTIDADGHWIRVFDPASGDAQKPFYEFALDPGGQWSFDLLPNESAIPLGTVYKREMEAGRFLIVDYFDVPAAGGPFTLHSRLTDPPATIESPAVALKVSRSGDTMTGPLIVNDDVTVAGQILTGTFGSPATFGGIEREGRVFPAGEMMSPTAVMNFGDGFPRVNMPADVTTDAYMIVEVEEWWLDSSIGVYFEWCNDHSAVGDVRFSCEIKECDIGTEALAAADVIASRTFTTTTLAANTPTTSIVASIANGNPCTFDPGPFASFYSLRISRLGADAADTLAGPIGLIAASMTRGQ
jgi:hypothetical protein